MTSLDSGLENADFLSYDLNLSGMETLAQNLAIILKKGDVLCLKGDLGVGKTTFARALIKSLLTNPDKEDIPSPSFALVQTYETPRFNISHYDFYRIIDASEVLELGLDDAADGLTVIEWPEKASEYLPQERLVISFGEDEFNHDQRHITFSGSDEWKSRLKRFSLINSFLEHAEWSDATRNFLQGDASSRTYTRLFQGADKAILMDAPKQPDGPPIKNGQAYSEIAHLAEDVVPFIAIAHELRKSGIYAPEILAHDVENGLVLLEDLGDDVFGTKISQGTELLSLYRNATDVLLKLHHLTPPEQILLDDDVSYQLPVYDQGVLNIEIELLLDWYWPALKGGTAPDNEKHSFFEHWQSYFKTLEGTTNSWVLRDFHSPNLILLDANKANGTNVGVIDFQDAQRGHAAYDLVSLLQDARLNVDADIETELLNYYCEKRHQIANGLAFDEAVFRKHYAILGAQRNTKILGIFARLAMRDGKRTYLAHIPRIWDYMERNLAHPELVNLQDWYNKYFPSDQRRQILDI